jgi:hypothetical protein
MIVSELRAGVSLSLSRPADGGVMTTPLPVVDTAEQLSANSQKTDAPVTRVSTAR